MERQFGERVPKFADIYKDGDESLTDVSILDWISSNEIGKDTLVKTPFGIRKVCYCDYTGSGRALNAIEDYIKSEVLTLYGNTHSSVTVTSEQSTLFLQEARDVIRNAVGASEQDAVLFVGNGATAAVELLIHLLDLTECIVIHGIQEHHSNLLPWREFCKESFIVKESAEGKIDVDDLLRTLVIIREKYGLAIPILGCFTAVSNITGIIMNIEDVNSVLFKWNCISIWDYASAAPYVKIEMNHVTPKGAIFFSGHKFIGGVQSPGVLVIKKNLIRSKRPKRGGGGTVSFVSATSHAYLKNVEYREEGGTPDVVGAVRLALAFKLKSNVGHDLIRNCEQEISRLVISFLAKCDNIVLLGSPNSDSRLAVFSFLVKDFTSGLFYHHNYISVLLNDLFGIQTRSGCACAGPYAQHLLGIDEELALKYRLCLMEDARLDRDHLRRHAEYTQTEMLRPGFTRVSIPFFASLKMVEFVLKAIEFVANNASRFITQYQLNCESAEWHHVQQRVFSSRKWLGFATFSSSGLSVKKNFSIPNQDGAAVRDIDVLLTEAEKFAAESEKAKTIVGDGREVLNAEDKKLRWFLLGSEVAEARSGFAFSYHDLPFKPKRFSFAAVPNELQHSSTFEVVAKLGLKNQDCKTDDSSEEEYCSDDAEETASSSHSLLEEKHVFGNSDKSTMSSEMATDGSACCSHLCSISSTSKVGWEVDEWNKRVVVTQKENLSEEEKKKQLWVRPPNELYKKAVEAIQAFNMIREGDRILVCLSGGKDSLSLLHVLHFYRESAIKHRKASFELGAITVDPCSSGYNPRPLIEYCRTLNINYFYEEQDIINQAAKLSKCRSICGYCSRMKRGRLTSAAKLHGYNVLAMGHHLDDLAESFLMAAFQNGNLSTMKAQYTTRERDLRIIRPLIYVREKSLREFAEKNSLPVIAENCPACFEQPKERHRIKQLLASYELIYPQLFASLRSALHPLLLVDAARTSGMRRMAIENVLKSYLEREKKLEAADNLI